MENRFMEFAVAFNQRLIQGEKVYEELNSIREEGVEYLICPEHIGDSIWICAFVSDYKKYHHCSKVYIVGKEPQLPILERFPEVDGTVSVTSEEMEAMRTYIYYSEKYYENHIRYAHFWVKYFVTNNGFMAVGLVDDKMRASMTYSRKKILDIAEEYNTTPSRMLLFDDGSDEELKKMFSESIFFLPAMQTQEGYLPDELFELLVDRYKEAGYQCYTNYNDFPYERLIRGTQPLSSSLQELSVIAPYFKQIIAVRSGAVDLLAQTDANLSVIYHQVDAKDATEICATPEAIGNMTVRKLVDRDGIKEYVYTPQKEEELIEAIFSQIGE